ncbi:MAG: long-chain fatty acid--CoA ligase [Candidatus Methanofastidiosia archaeon]|jgi:long-chain acyl-CoA synthetase
MKKIWLDHYPEDVPDTVDIPDIPVFTFLDDSAKMYPETTATIFMGAKLTYKELAQQVNKLACGLSTLGIKKGDRVGLFFPNCPQSVIAFYAALKLGAVVVQYNPLYVERELIYQINDSGTETLLTLDLELLYPKIRNIKDKVNLNHVIVSSLKEYLPFPKNVLYPLVKRKDIASVSSDTISFQTLLQKGDTPPDINVHPQDLALLQYTGGTTGVSKGVMLTHKNLVANALQCKSWFPEVSFGKESLLAVLPFFHSFGLTVAMNVPVYVAATMILVPRFKTKEILSAIQEYKPSLFPGVPTMYVAINNHPDVKKYDLSSVEYCISGAAPLPLDVLHTFEQLTGGKLREGYGLTEASPVTHSNPLEGLIKKGSIGIPFPNTDCKIVDVEEGTHELAIDTLGELCIKGPQVMEGYWHQPEETDNTLRNGWLHTGDIAKVDNDGYFYIVDRKTDMIIASGFNIYPRDIEEVLYEFPKIKEAAVAGVPDEYRGETVKAFIVLKEGVKATKEEIIDFCRKNLAKYKVPKEVEFKDELPKTIVGKVLRRELVEEEKEENKN